MKHTRTVDVAIVGAGASGLMCAREAGARGRSVVVLDHTQRVGRKILVSGGGKCNFTNRTVTREHYLSRNPHFAVSALSRFSSQDFIKLVERHHISYEERRAGRIFCTGGSSEIVAMLVEECRRSGVSFLLGCKIEDVDKPDVFVLKTNAGRIESQSLVIASGGLAAPALGATNFGHQVAHRFGLKVTPLRPALTPLKFNAEDARDFGALSGISLPAVVSCNGARFHEEVLFTHTGLSGPAALQISSYWDDRSSITLDLLPELDVLGRLLEVRSRPMHLATFLDRLLPGRLVKAWCRRCVPSKPLKQYTLKELEGTAAALHNWSIRPADRHGFDKAEVTLGGVDTRELSSKTMESRKVPGLYFTGEVVDVTGQLGGYNLQWAWASGVAAGRYA